MCIIMTTNSTSSTRESAAALLLVTLTTGDSPKFISVLTFFTGFSWVHIFLSWSCCTFLPPNYHISNLRLCMWMLINWSDAGSWCYWLLYGKENRFPPLVRLTFPVCTHLYRKLVALAPNLQRFNQHQYESSSILREFPMTSLSGMPTCES